MTRRFERRTLHVEQCMGTVFSIDVRDPGNWEDAIGRVVAWLHHVDAVFSTYRVDSHISRIGRRELPVGDADPLVATVLELCAQVHATTRGYFTAFPDGRLDPTGLVKGWAIDRASTLLREHGAANHAVNGGGDVQLAGEATPDRPWSIGIADPLDRTRVLTVVTGRDFAVASSGTGERGTHIVNPFTGNAADVLAGVTVIGPKLTEVDAYATAAFAMGDEALDWVESLGGYEALVVGKGGTVRRTTGFARVEGRA